MFHILATFTKSFDKNHSNHGSDASKKLHLIASTAVLPGSLDIGMLLRAFDGDMRDKKTLVIEITQLFNKETNFVEIDEDYLKKNSLSWNQVKTSIEESGKGAYMNSDKFSYLKLDFDYFILLLENSDSLNLFTMMLNLEYDEKRKIENLYNQFLFVFDSIL